MERKHEIKFKIHDVEKSEFEKFLKLYPEFDNDMETLCRVGLSQYIYAYRDIKKHITEECINLIG